MPRAVLPRRLGAIAPMLLVDLRGPSSGADVHPGYWRRDAVLEPALRPRCFRLAMYPAIAAVTNPYAPESIPLYLWWRPVVEADYVVGDISRVDAKVAMLGAVFAFCTL